MNVSNKIILITGGGSGIGFEIAKQLIAKGNRVIITGRSESRLQKAAEQLNNVSYIVSDITRPEDAVRLRSHLENLGGLDILINNAGNAHTYKLAIDASTATRATEEFTTNVFSAMRLIDELLPLLLQSDDAAIVNVSSTVALVPAGSIPTYSASKAALHSYTQSLRLALSKNTSIKVFELMPPLVDTEFSTEIGGENGIPPSEVADSLLKGLENDTYEILTGNTAAIYHLSRAATYAEAFKLMNQEEEV
ncbi:SDR family oxidoreductase [Dyadobacter frigoris]|uniref:SDR family NAD(P)-dependent oxidoreductase n=1 Tax=Dyadobacter frigoris TaxID=2576211 RepID=A0A4U6D9E8_9BACT|nr:SDR family NAD(P)-dependent oxidoreductase [Dyadobacter frigoris]TKT93416.1 SDR family NAD(P)-dependent oxidoreductase [Dyadobacter frigoris]GLU54728.1 oxidoreductase [Dyadobacter frigoris]